MIVVILKSPRGADTIAIYSADLGLLIPGIGEPAWEGDSAYEAYAGGGVGPAAPLEAVIEFVKNWKPPEVKP